MPIEGEDASAAGLARTHIGLARAVRRAGTSWSRGVYSLFGECVVGGFTGDPQELSIAKRFMLVPWLLFALIVLSTYTANLAAFLGNQPVKLPVSSAQDCIRRNCNLCDNGYALAVEQMGIFVPELVPRRVLTTYTDVELWEGIGNKTSPSAKQLSPQCDAIYQFDTNYIMTPGYADGPCNVVSVGTQLFSLTLAWPVRNEFAEAMNFYILEEKNAGTWQALVTKYTPHQECAGYRLDSASSADDQDKITPLMLSGPILVVIVGSSAALLMTALAVVGKRSKGTVGTSMEKKKFELPEVSSTLVTRSSMEPPRAARV